MVSNRTTANETFNPKRDKVTIEEVIILLQTLTDAGYYCIDRAVLHRTIDRFTQDGSECDSDVEVDVEHCEGMGLRDPRSVRRDSSARSTEAVSEVLQHG